MPKLLLKVARYAKCYGELAFGAKPRTIEEIVDYCVDRPVLMTQVRSEILALGQLLQAHAPARSLEIGTNYGGTLFLLCSLSSPGATIISVDLPSGRFGGGYPLRKIPLFHKFTHGRQKLHLIRGDSHSAEAKARVLRILAGQPLDYLFIDGDHTYAGVQRDFEMYSPLVRSGGIVAFHDIATHSPDSDCQVERFWREIKPRYRHHEIIENVIPGSRPIAITGLPMDTSGLGLLFMP